MLRRTLLALSLLVLTTAADAAVVVTKSAPTTDGAGRRSWVYTLTVTSDASGNASAQTVVKGFIMSVTLDPAGGADVPTTLWDFSAVVRGADVLGTAGMNQTITDGSAADTKRVLPKTPGDGLEYTPWVDGTVVWTFAGMGDTNKAVVYVDLKE